MTALDIAAHDTVSFADLKTLSAAGGPCLTIVEFIPNPLELATRLKNSIRGAQKELSAQGMDAETVTSFLEPIKDVATEADTERIWADALILLRSPDLFRFYLLEGQMKAVFTIGEKFQVRPLLSAVSREQRFHLLALSQQQVRLFHCTQHSAEEARVDGVVPQNMRLWLNNEQPDHVLENRSSAGPSVGSMKGVLFGSSADHERPDAYLTHFLKAVDKGIHQILRNDTAPLVVAGVEYEQAIYRRLNTYPRLLEDAVQGSPDGEPVRTLHQSAKQIVNRSFSPPLQKALADFQKHRDGGRVSSHVREIIRAAYQGRVEDLFISFGADVRGAWDETAQDIEAGASADRQEDLLNAAALQTVLHGGNTFELGGKDMPVTAQVAAVLRF